MDKYAKIYLDFFLIFSFDQIYNNVLLSYSLNVNVKQNEMKREKKFVSHLLKGIGRNKLLWKDIIY